MERETSFPPPCGEGGPKGRVGVVAPRHANRNNFLDKHRGCVHDPFVSAAVLPDLPTLPRRLGLILDGLRRVLAARAAKDPALAVLVLILWNRLSRIQARVTAIVARQQAGRLRPPATRRRPGRVGATPPPRDKLPRQRAWLLRRVQDCAVYGGQLRLLLDDPEVAEMIQAVPQLRPLLRPLWRMLRTEPTPEVLRTPPVTATSPPRRTIRRSGHVTPHAVTRPLPAPRHARPGPAPAQTHVSVKRA